MFVELAATIGHLKSRAACALLAGELAAMQGDAAACAAIAAAHPRLPALQER